MKPIQSIMIFLIPLFLFMASTARFVVTVSGFGDDSDAFIHFLREQFPEVSQEEMDDTAQSIKTSHFSSPLIKMGLDNGSPLPSRHIFDENQHLSHPQSTPDTDSVSLQNQIKPFRSGNSAKIGGMKMMDLKTGQWKRRRVRGLNQAPDERTSGARSSTAESDDVKVHDNLPTLDPRLGGDDDPAFHSTSGQPFDINIPRHSRSISSVHFDRFLVNMAQYSHSSWQEIAHNLNCPEQHAYLLYVHLVENALVPANRIRPSLGWTREDLHEEFYRVSLSERLRAIKQFEHAIWSIVASQQGGGIRRGAAETRVALINMMLIGGFGKSGLFGHKLIHLAALAKLCLAAARQKDTFQPKQHDALDIACELIQLP